MLKTQDLSFSYDGKNFLSFPDVHCAKGEHWLLLGQSGSGKTTLLHLLGGLRSPKRGKVFIDGNSLGDMDSADLDLFRGQKVGIVFQQAHFLKALTVGENLAIAQQLAGKPISMERIKELLERLRIGHKLNQRPGNLSQGEQQRLAIARALVNRPLIILADEPTSALDDTNCEEVIQLLEQQAEEENATLLIVTHDGRLKERFEKRIIL
ncbi:MAG: ATP-binding cassette domain-containing protein [Bacteroidota bacterium]